MVGAACQSRRGKSKNRGVKGREEFRRAKMGILQVIKFWSSGGMSGRQTILVEWEANNFGRVGDKQSGRGNGGNGSPLDYAPDPLQRYLKFPNFFERGYT